jgi:nucleotide-binding universal stress UspA family protein
MTKITETDAPTGTREESSDWRRIGQGPTNLERILVPTDLTAGSERAIQYGIALARRCAAHLTLLHVYKEPYAIEYIRGPHACDEVLRERAHFMDSLKSISKEVKKEYSDCDFEFRDGAPCEEIVNAAKERNIDLIIISTHHYTWLKRLACGCDAEQILRHAPCPILVL